MLRAARPGAIALVPCAGAGAVSEFSRLPVQPRADLRDRHSRPQPADGIQRADLGRAGRVLRGRRLHHRDLHDALRHALSRDAADRGRDRRRCSDSLVGIPALRWQGLPLAFITFGLAVLVPPLALKLEPITKGATGISMPKPDAAGVVSRQPGHVPLPDLPRRRGALRADRLAPDARRHRALAARGARQRADRGIARHQSRGGARSPPSPPARASRASAAGCSRS